LSRTADHTHIGTGHELLILLACATYLFAANLNMNSP